MSPVIAQDKSVAPANAPKRTIAPVVPGSRLVLVAQAPLTKARLEDVLQEALQESKCSCIGNAPQVREIPPDFFDILDTFEQATSDAQKPLRPNRDDLQVSPALSVNSQSFTDWWEFRPMRPKKYLKSLELTYSGDKSETISPSKDKDRFRRINATRDGGEIYQFRLTGKPLRYKAVLGELEKPDESVENEWPKLDSYYLITMQDFRGEFSEFQAALADKNQVSAPLTKIREVSDLRLLFANFGYSSTEGEICIWGNQYHVKVLPLKDRTVARVLIYFPLTEEELKETLPGLRDLEIGLKVSQAIKEKGIIGSNQEVKLSPDSKPQWIVLKPQNDERPQDGPFRRSFPLENLSALKTKFPRLFYLVVWEFESPKTKQLRAIPFEKKGLGEAFVDDVEEKAWIVGVDKEIEKQTKK